MSRSVKKQKGQTETAMQIRYLSLRAVAALDYFHELRPFFKHDSELARALDWDEATVMAWKNGQVIRPREEKIDQVLELRELCEEVQPYLSKKHDVGAWVNVSQPILKISPSEWVRENGIAGMKEVFRVLVNTMQPTPARDVRPLSDVVVLQGLRRATKHNPSLREVTVKLGLPV
jgi:hypothetical protein